MRHTFFPRYEAVCRIYFLSKGSVDVLIDVSTATLAQMTTDISGSKVQRHAEVAYESRENLLVSLLAELAGNKVYFRDGLSDSFKCCHVCVVR